MYSPSEITECIDTLVGAMKTHGILRCKYGEVEILLAHLPAVIGDAPTEAKPALQTEAERRAEFESLLYASAG